MEDSPDPLCAYDPFARIYDRYYSNFTDRIFPILYRMLLKRLGKGAHILDLCCGGGQMSQLLLNRGYGPTGLDSSAEMLRYARTNCPEGRFVRGDARRFAFARKFDGAIAVFDSLNHILSIDGVAAALKCIHASLAKNGLLFFDLNWERGYQDCWGDKGFNIVEDDHACIVRGSWRQEEQLARLDTTVFRLDEGVWKRKDFVVEQKCHPREAIDSLLAETGFELVEIQEAVRDIDSEEKVRAFFLCRKIGEM